MRVSETRPARLCDRESKKQIMNRPTPNTTSKFIITSSTPALISPCLRLIFVLAPISPPSPLSHSLFLAGDGRRRGARGDHGRGRDRRARTQGGASPEHSQQRRMMRRFGLKSRGILDARKVSSRPHTHKPAQPPVILTPRKDPTRFDRNHGKLFRAVGHLFFVLFISLVCCIFSIPDSLHAIISRLRVAQHQCPDGALLGQKFIVSRQIMCIQFSNFPYGSEAVFGTFAVYQCGDKLGLSNGSDRCGVSGIEARAQSTKVYE
jgi:hypothetical protein